MISVIMPVYNGQKYLKEAIESVLSQTFSDFELIIIDDKSEDSSLDIAKNFSDNRIKIIENDRNGGIGYSRNKGIEIANGKYISMLDADDIAEPNKLEVQFNVMEKDKEIDILGSSYYIINETGEKIDIVKGFYDSEFIKHYLIFGNCVGNSTIMIRKEFMEKNNIRYNEEIFVGEDYNLLVQAARLGKIKCMSDVLVKYRVSDDNNTNISMKRRSEKRDIIISNIKKMALKNLKIELNENEFEVFEKIFTERYVIKDEKEVEMLKDLLQRIIKIYDQKESKLNDVVRIVFSEKIRTWKSIWI